MVRSMLALTYAAESEPIRGYLHALLSDRMTPKQLEEVTSASEDISEARRYFESLFEDERLLGMHVMNTNLSDLLLAPIVPTLSVPTSAAPIGRPAAAHIAAPPHAAAAPAPQAESGDVPMPQAPVMCTALTVKGAACGVRAKVGSNPPRCGRHAIAPTVVAATP